MHVKFVCVLFQETQWSSNGQSSVFCGITQFCATYNKHLPLETKMAMPAEIMRYSSVSWAFKMYKQTISRCGTN